MLLPTVLLKHGLLNWNIAKLALKTANNEDQENRKELLLLPFRWLTNSYIMSGDQLLCTGQWVKKMNHLYVHVCSFSASTLTPLFGWSKWHPGCKRIPEVPFLNTWMEKTEGSHKPSFCKVTVKMEVVMAVCVCVWIRNYITHTLLDNTHIVRKIFCFIDEQLQPLTTACNHICNTIHSTLTVHCTSHNVWVTFPQVVVGTSQ